MYTEHTPQELMRKLSTHMTFEKVPLKHAEHTCQELMHTLSIHVGNTEHMHQELMCMLNICIN